MTSSQKPRNLMRKPPEGLFARLLDSLTDMYALVLDEDLRITYANVSFLKHFGLKWEKIIGRPCQDLGTPFLGTDNLAVGFCPEELSPWYPARTLLTREAQDKVYVYECTLNHLEGSRGASLEPVVSPGCHRPLPAGIPGPADGRTGTQPGPGLHGWDHRQ